MTARYGQLPQGTIRKRVEMIEAASDVCTGFSLLPPGLIGFQTLAPKFAGPLIDCVRGQFVKFRQDLLPDAKVRISVEISEPFIVDVEEIASCRFLI